MVINSLLGVQHKLTYWFMHCIFVRNVIFIIKIPMISSHEISIIAHVHYDRWLVIAGANDKPLLFVVHPHADNHTATFDRSLFGSSRRSIHRFNGELAPHLPPPCYVDATCSACHATCMSPFAVSPLELEPLDCTIEGRSLCP